MLNDRPLAVLKAKNKSPKRLRANETLNLRTNGISAGQAASQVNVPYLTDAN
jgi:hypothetical protein